MKTIMSALVGLALSWFGLAAAAAAVAPIHAVGQFPEELRDSDHDGIADIDDNCPNTSRETFTHDRQFVTNVDSCGCPLDPCKNDEDHDGVVDCDDLCPHTRLGIQVGGDGCPLPIEQPFRYRLDVKFEFAEANILGSYTPDLDKLRQVLVQFPNVTVTLEGHTDSRGGDSYNQALSEARANACRRYLLLDSRIAASRVRAIGHGKTQPIADNRSDHGRAQNRRTIGAIYFDRDVKPPNSMDDLLQMTPSAASAK